MSPGYGRPAVGQRNQSAESVAPAP